MAKKTHWREIIESEYLGAPDLFTEDGTFETAQFTIKRAGKEQVLNQQSGKKESELLCWFYETSKPMILNVTNSKAIEKLAGTPHIEDWAGLMIEIGVQKVRAFGELWDALRVSPKKLGRAGKQSKPKGDMTADVLTGIKDFAVEAHGDKGGDALKEMIAEFAAGKWNDLKVSDVGKYTEWISAWGGDKSETV